MTPWTSLPGSSVHGILQARILEWAALLSSQGSSRPRDWTHVSGIGRRVLYHWPTWETLLSSAPTFNCLKNDSLRVLASKSIVFINLLSALCKVKCYHFLFTCTLNLHITTTKKLKAQYCSKYYANLWMHPVEYYRLSHYSPATLAQPHLACGVWWKQWCLAHTVILSSTSGNCTQEWQWRVKDPF